jgi:hypothetical protein
MPNNLLYLSSPLLFLFKILLMVGSLRLNLNLFIFPPYFSDQNSSTFPVLFSLCWRLLNIYASFDFSLCSYAQLISDIFHLTAFSIRSKYFKRKIFILHTNPLPLWPLIFLKLWSSLPKTPVYYSDYRKTLPKVFNASFHTLYTYHSANIKIASCQPGRVEHACNPGTLEAEAGGLNIWGQPKLHREIFSQKNTLLPIPLFWGVW